MDNAIAGRVNHARASSHAIRKNFPRSSCVARLEGDQRLGRECSLMPLDRVTQPHGARLIPLGTGENVSLVVKDEHHSFVLPCQLRRIERES